MNTLIIFGAKYLIIVVAVVALIFFLKQSKETKKQLAIFALISLPVIYVVAKISSLFFYDPRPFVAGNFTPLIAHAPDNGFPSDHTLLSAAIAAVVYFFNKKLGAFLFLLALIVGLSRVLAGVHHFVDILGSFVIAILFSFLTYKLVLPKVFKNKLI